MVAATVMVAAMAESSTVELEKKGRVCENHIRCFSLRSQANHPYQLDGVRAAVVECGTPGARVKRQSLAAAAECVLHNPTID